MPYEFHQGTMAPNSSFHHYHPSYTYDAPYSPHHPQISLPLKTSSTPGVAPPSPPLYSFPSGATFHHYQSEDQGTLDEELFYFTNPNHSLSQRAYDDSPAMVKPPPSSFGSAFSPRDAAEGALDDDTGGEASSSPIAARGLVVHLPREKMLAICAQAVQPRDVASAFEACGGAHNLLSTLFPITERRHFTCPFVKSRCGYVGNKERDNLRRHFKDKHGASLQWKCPLCHVTMGSGANGQISHEASHKGDVSTAEEYAKVGKTLPSPTAAEVCRLAALDVDISEEPAITFEWTLVDTAGTSLGTSSSHSTSPALWPQSDFRLTCNKLAKEVYEAHSNEAENSHKWLDSFMESVKSMGLPKEKGQLRPAVSEMMKTPGRRRVGLTPSHNNMLSTSKGLTKDPLPHLLFGNARQFLPASKAGKENDLTPPAVRSPASARKPLSGSSSINNKAPRGVFSPVRSAPMLSPRALHSPHVKKTAPPAKAVLSPPPQPSPVVAVQQPTEDEFDEEVEEAIFDTTLEEEMVGDLSNVIEEDEDAEEEAAPVEANEDSDDDDDDDLIQEELVGQSSFDAEQGTANLSMIGEEEEEEGSPTKVPGSKSSSSPARVSGHSSIVLLDSQSSTVPETQLSPVAASLPEPLSLPRQTPLSPPVAPQAAIVPITQPIDTAELLASPRPSTSSIASSSAVAEADADVAVPLNDGPSTLRNALASSASAPSSASSSRTPGAASRYAAGSYSAAKPGLGLNIGSSPPPNGGHQSTSTTPGFGLGRPSTGGAHRAQLNFVGLPKKSLPFALGRNMGSHASWTSTGDSQGSQSSVTSAGASQQSQPSTQATTVASGLSSTNSLASVAGVKRKSTSGPDVPNKKLGRESAAGVEDGAESNKTTLSLLHRLNALNGTRASIVARPSAIGFSALPPSSMAPKSLPSAASAPILPITNALPAPAPTPVEPAFVAPAPAPAPQKASAIVAPRSSITPAPPAPIPSIASFLSPSRRSSALNATLRSPSTTSGQSFLPTLTRRTSVKDIAKTFEHRTDSRPLSPSKPPPASSSMYKSTSMLFSPGSPGLRAAPPTIARAMSPLPPNSPRPAAAKISVAVPTVMSPAPSHRMTLRSPSPAQLSARSNFSVVVPVPQAASKAKKPTSVVEAEPVASPPRERITTTPDATPPKEVVVLAKAGQPEPEVLEQDDEEMDDDDEDEYGEEDVEEPVVTVAKITSVPPRHDTPASASEAEDEEEEEDTSEQFPLPSRADAHFADNDSYGSDTEDEDDDSVLIVEPGRGALASAFDDTRMEADTFDFTTVKPKAQPFRPAPPPGAVKTNLIRPSPNKVVMPGSFEEAAGDSDDDVAGDLLHQQKSGHHRTLSMQSSMSSQQSSSRSTSQQSQNAPGGNGLGRSFGAAGQSKKGEAPKAVKSIQLAAAAARKEKEETERRAAAKEETQKKRLALIQKKQEEDRSKAEDEKRSRVEGAEKKRKERDEADRKAKLNRSAIKAKTDRAIEEEPQKKRKVEEPKRQEVKKAPQASRPFPATTSYTNLNSSLSTSIGRTGMAGPSNPLKSSQNGLKNSVTAAGFSSTSMIGVKYQNNDQIRLGNSTNAPPSAARVAALNQKSFQPTASISRPPQPRPEPEVLQELPDIDSEYSDSGDEEHAEKVANYPQWVQSPAGLLSRQQFTNPDELFGPMPPLSMKDIFKTNSTRFSKRSSSACWEGTDELTEQEMVKYSRVMGYQN
ncbi:hypothetical protein P7C70_g4082, partial [Phenoliferia sp. Uapishka_3]